MRILLFTKTGQRNKGFSLIELIVAIAIMAILTGIAAMSYSNLSGAKVSKCAKELYSSIENVRASTMGKDSVILTLRRDSSGKYYADTITTSDGTTITSTEEIGSKKVTVNYTYYDSTTVHSLEADDSITISFDRGSGALKADSSGNYLKSMEITGRGKEYTITFYKNTGNVELE